MTPLRSLRALCLQAGFGLCLLVAPLPGAEPDPQAPPRKRAPAAPAEPVSEEIRLRADTQEQVAEGHFRARGFVDLQSGGIRLQADRADLYETKDAAGKVVSDRVVAEGNVVFMRGEERLSGTRAEVDLTTGKGFFENAVGYVEPGVFVEARRIERLDDKTYRVHGGKFTSCSQPNPRWKFQASSATIHVDDKITATNVLFRVKSVPAFYLPFVYYPIREDQRSTGFLFPHFGFSDTRGYNIGSGFFWAMNRSLDQTLYVDYYSRFGYGLGHEFRYVGPSPSRGVFRTYGFKPQGGGPWDYDLDWNAYAQLLGRIETSLQVRQYSDIFFQQQFQDNFNLATTRTRRSALSLQRTWKATTFQVAADSTDTFFGEFVQRNRRLPAASVRRYPQRLGRTGILFGYWLAGENLAFGPEETLREYYRFDVGPEIARPLSTSFLQFTPRAAYRYTRYGRSAVTDPDGNTVFEGPPVDRTFFEGSVDMRGPTFSRVFNRPGGFYSEKIKHIIGPEVFWTYRTPIEEFSQIPKYDGNDYFLGTNQLTYSLVQRLLAKRPAYPGGKPVAYEFLTWRVSQTYYVRINEGQNNFDPNYSSSAFGPGGRREHLSPLVSRFRVRPTPSLSTDFNLEYDVNFKQIRTLGLFGTYTWGRGSLQTGWSRVQQLVDPGQPAQTISNTVRGSLRFELLPRRLTLDGGADYDFLRKHFLTSRARLRWDVQCCGFVVEAFQFNYNSRTERQFRFAIELANVGSIGNFLGQDALRMGLGSYR